MSWSTFRKSASDLLENSLPSNPKLPAFLNICCPHITLKSIFCHLLYIYVWKHYFSLLHFHSFPLSASPPQPAEQTHKFLYFRALTSLGLLELCAHSPRMPLLLLSPSPLNLPIFHLWTFLGTSFASFLGHPMHFTISRTLKSNVGSQGQL